MDSMDQALQQRVWQRVRSASGPEPPEPEGLLLEERTDEALLRLLGIPKPLEGFRRRIAVLQGICRLSGLPDATLMPKPQRSNTAAALRSLMGRLLRRHREYTTLAAQSEYAPLYGALADSCAESCVLLAAHIGSTPLRNRKE